MKTALKATKQVGIYILELLYLIAMWAVINITTSGLIKEGHVVSAIIFLFVAFYLVLLTMRMYSNWKSKRVEGLTTTLKHTLVEEATYVFTITVLASLVYTGVELYHHKTLLFYGFTGAFVLSVVCLIISGVIKVTGRGN